MNDNYQQGNSEPTRHGIRFRIREFMSKPVFQGSLVVAACFLSMLIVGGIGWYTFPVFISSLKKEFSCTDLELGLVVGMWAGVGALFSPVAGRLVDRFGSRWIMLAGVAGCGLTTAIMAEIRTIGHLYAIGFFAVFFMTAATYVPVVSVISRWFGKGRGLAMSIAMVGMALGGFLLPNLANILIQNVGWRWTYRIFGIIIWIVLFPVVARWLHDPPADIGLVTQGDDHPGQENGQTQGFGAKEDGFSVREALGMPRLWILGFAELANSVPIVALSFYMVRFSIQGGIANEVAALAYSSISAMAILGMIAVGLLVNSFNRRILISACYGLPALSVLFLFGLESTGPLFCFTIIAGLCTGCKATLWPLVVSDCFGSRAYSSILGYLLVFYNLGIVVGPPLAGWISDTTGSFDGVFVLGVAAFFGSSLLIALGTKSRMV